jgi:protein tyrosine phosphatase (PTP) superfamily phosphohydrolase (DUF442 family)
MKARPLVPFLVPAVLFAAGASGCGGNFHVIDPDRCYRSAQLDAETLETVVREHGIRTVINLRGPNPGEPWYDDEVATTARLGVEQIDIGMSAQRLPHRRDLLRLLEAFDDAERPVLIHCLQGADRSGEAAALYRIECMGASKDEALEELSLCYGHLGFWYPAKRHLVEIYGGREWARDGYDPCEGTWSEHYDPSEHAECSVPKSTVPPESPAQDRPSREGALP